MVYMYVRLVLASIFIFGAYKWGDWKNWNKYYATMLFFGMGDLIYHLVFYDKPLWKFQTDFLVDSLNELFVIFTIFFSTTLIYLSNFPKRFMHRIMYISLWVLIYMGIECFTTRIGMHINYNGWNIWWSLLHNAIQFPLLYIHHKKPILAWNISFVFLGFIMWKFNMDFVVGK